MRYLLSEAVLSAWLRGDTSALRAKGLARMQCRPVLVLDARRVSLHSEIHSSCLPEVSAWLPEKVS